MEWPSGNIMIRPMCLSTDSPMIGHAHRFDHTTILFNRSFVVDATLLNGKKVEQEFTGPAHLLIKAGVEHRFTPSGPSNKQIVAEIESMPVDQLRAALIAVRTADPIAWCVYSHRSPQGDVIQQNIGWHPAYG